MKPCLILAALGAIWSPLLALAQDVPFVFQGALEESV
jgi:hypothetical protein